MDITLHPRGYYKRGDKSPEIIKIQTALQAQGFWGNVAFNENFGPATDAAVRSFQQAKGLKVDGLVGTDSLKALGFTVTGNNAGSTSGSGQSTPTPTPAQGAALLQFDHGTRQFVNVKKDAKYDQSYRSLIDATKMPAPQLTKAKLIDWKLKAEGGLSRNTNDSASSYPCPTPYNGVSGYHTNKGITYKTWRSYFDASQDMRFYAMSHDDWSTIFDKLYWNPNAVASYPETINCLIVSFAWGGSMSATVKGAESILGTAVNKADLAAAVAALLSARGQLFINISQPGSRNNGFRIGWISNALNKLVKVTYGL
jgi:peptidoglycan hydrolase-like protein with peptidoglycan-binding domain